MQEMKLQELKNKTPTDLLAFAESVEVENASVMRKQELMFAILKQLAGMWRSSGKALSIYRTDSSCPANANYLPGPDDIYISPSQIQAVLHKVAFDNLTPLYPDERLKMEIEDPTIKDRSPASSTLSPIGKGQRALIVAPPRTGKTVLLQNIAHSIETNHPECYLIVLLIDERPEEVTDMQRSVKGEVISSTFDEPATRHVARSPKWSSKRPSAWWSTSATSSSCSTRSRVWGVPSTPWFHPRARF
jgi:transcription termination factor Rho